MQKTMYSLIYGQERELSELSSGFISVVKIIQSIISAYSAFTNATDLLNVKGVVLIDEIEKPFAHRMANQNRANAEKFIS